MAMTWTENGDSRANLGPSVIIQQNTGQPAASDYPTGGYPINPQSWGLGEIRGLHPVGQYGTAANYLWVFVPLAPASLTSTLCGYLQVQSVAGTQVAAGTDLSGGQIKLLAYGI